MGGATFVSELNESSPAIYLIPKSDGGGSGTVVRWSAPL